MRVILKRFRFNAFRVENKYKNDLNRRRVSKLSRQSASSLSPCSNKVLSLNKCSCHTLSLTL